MGWLSFGLVFSFDTISKLFYSHTVCSACLWPVLPFVATYSHYVHLRFSRLFSSFIPQSTYLWVSHWKGKRNLLYSINWFKKVLDENCLCNFFKNMLKDIKWQNQIIHCILCYYKNVWPFPALCAQIHIICPCLILICKARPIWAQFESVNNLRTLLFWWLYPFWSIISV